MKSEPLALPELVGQPLHVGLEQERVGVDAAQHEVRDFGLHGPQLSAVPQISFVSCADEREGEKITTVESRI